MIPLLVPFAIAAALALLAGLAWFKPEAQFRPPAPGPLVVEITSSHVRSLLADHLLDITSSDQHTVKPWFAGKIQYSPPVKELTAAGFRLAGGRLDYLNNQKVAALVYQYNKHVINLFIWPLTGKQAPGESIFARDGYNLVHWEKDGMTYWAVSDVAQDVLRKFCQTIEEIASEARLGPTKCMV